MPESYKKIARKIRCPINKEITFFFTPNEFIDFLESIWSFFLFLKILKNERNVTNFGSVFVPRFHHVHKFSEWLNYLEKKNLKKFIG